MEIGRGRGCVLTFVYLPSGESLTRERAAKEAEGLIERERKKERKYKDKNGRSLDGMSN